MPEYFEIMNQSSENLEKTFIQHPADVALDYKLNAADNQLCLALDTPIPKRGGLTFDNKKPLSVGSMVSLKIAPFRPALRVKGVVTYCTKRKDYYQIGVEFMNVDDAFRVRMTEQACYIEHYKNELQKEQGKKISREQAALEWIAICGASFPNPQ